MPRFFCTMINKWNLPRETTQVACPISFRNRKPGLDNGRMSLVSLLIQTCKHLLYWIFPNVGECSGYLYSVGSLPDVSSVSGLSVESTWLSCKRCSLSPMLHSLCCEVGKAGSRCVVNIDVKAAWRAACPQSPGGAPVLRGMRCVLCGEGRASHQRPALRWVSDCERTVVHCDFMRGECRVPCLLYFLDPRTPPPPRTYTHTEQPEVQCLQTYFGKHCVTSYVQN